MTRHLLVLALVGCAALVACRDDSKDDDQQEDIPETVTLRLDPTAVELPEGGNVPVQLVTTLTGDLVGMPVVYAVSAPSEGVTATVVGDTLALGAALFTAHGPSTLTVSATAGGMSASTTLVVTVGPPTPMTVSGRLIDFDMGQPVVPSSPGQIVVSAWGRGGAAKVSVTPTDDTFEIPGIVPPYDLLVDVAYDASLDLPTRMVIMGLTRQDPIVVYLGEDVLSARTAHRLGVTMGPVARETLTRYAYVCDDGPWSSSAFDYPSGGGGSGSELLSGTTTSSASTCTLEAFAYHIDDNERPSEFAPMTTATRTVDLNSPGETFVPLDLNIVPGRTMPVDASFADAIAFGHWDLRWLAHETSSIRLSQTASTTPPASVIAPPVAGVELALCLSSELHIDASIAINTLGTTRCRRIASDVESVTFGEIPAPSLPGAPSGAVDATTVTFDQAPGFHGYVIVGDATYGVTMLFTAAPVSATTLAAYGLSLAPGDAYTWQSATFDGIDDPDTFATPQTSARSVADRNGSYTLSALQAFQTN